MKHYNINRVLVIPFGENGREAEVEISFNYYKSSYGDDADGNRGIPSLELSSYDIEVATTCLNRQKIADEEHNELYKDAFSEVMRNWETWTYED
jgi:hypothetical protein